MSLAKSFLVLSLSVLVSIPAFAAKIQCRDYSLPNDCSYDAYDARDWVCEKNYPSSPSGAPYDQILQTIIELKGQDLFVLNQVLDLNETLISQKPLLFLKDVICIDGVTNCETAGRKTGFYVVVHEDTREDRSETLLILRDASGRRELASFLTENCK